MSRWDDDIERTLAGLRNTTPPAGLESRVLARLHTPPTGNPSRSHRWLLAVPALAACALTAYLVHPRRPGHSASTVVSRVAPLSLIAPLPYPPSKPSLHQPVRRPHASASPAHEVGSLAVGFPAPEPPLTDQERLLLRLARRPTPSTLALFDPQVREQRAQLAAADFKEFFKPPPVLLQPIILKDVPPEETNEPNPSKR